MSASRHSAVRFVRYCGACSLLLGTTVVLAAPGAERIDRYEAEIADLERGADGLTIQVGAPDTADERQLAEHRLVDAQVLYNLKDYSRAAILLLDYVNRYRSQPGYGDALYYLADALYRKRDFMSAKRYFKMIVSKRGAHYQESLQRLVELSLTTGDTSEVDKHLAALANIPASQLKPSVPYVVGKYYFFTKRTDEALRTFGSIPQGHKYYMHAQYFVGASHVRKKDHAAAVQTFQRLLSVQPSTKGQKYIRELTHLALGRLLYDQNKITAAIDQYQKVSRHSDAFDTMLYESAWAYVKANRFETALRALDLLVLARPDSPHVPDVTVLQGNLLIRLKQWGRATELFTSTRDRFVPIHQRMEQVLTEHSDPNVFFDALLARSSKSGSLAVTVKMPRLAMHWVNEKPRVKRSLALVGDVRNIRDNIRETNVLVGRLENRLNSPGKIRVFPNFAQTRARAVEVENRLAVTRVGLIDAERELVNTVASPAEKQEMMGREAQRAAVEQQISRLPTTIEKFNSRTKDRHQRLGELDARLSKLAAQAQSLMAQMVAVEKYFADTAGAKDKAVRTSFRAEADDLRTVLAGLNAQLDDLRRELDDARDSSGVGGPEEVAERSLKAQFKALVAQEHQYLAGFRSRLTPAGQAEFDRTSRLLSRCDGIDSKLMAFSTKLDSAVEQRLGEIRAVISEEKQLLAQYSTSASGYKADTDRVAGDVTYNGFREVAQRFYDIIVRADVGIIDVSWALKDAKTKEVSSLARQRKLDMELLDAEFKDVLRKD